MKIRIYSDGEINLYRLLRRAGYHPYQSPKYGISYIKSIAGRGYPRFHIYPKKDRSSQVLSIHMDMKKPSYPGSHAHNAEYENQRLRSECQRLKSFLSSQDIEVEIET